MRILRKREGYWYLDKKKILNSNNLVSLENAIIDDKDSQIFDSELDRMCLIESYNEMVCELRNMYAAKLRMYDNFQNDKYHIWINSDAQIKWFDLYKLDHEEVFLGIWNKNFKEKIYSSVSLLCQRILIIKREWYEQARQSLVSEKYLRKELL